MLGNSPVRCEVGEKLAITSKAYLHYSNEFSKELFSKNMCLIVGCNTFLKFFKIENVSAFYYNEYWVGWHAWPSAYLA
jgi:hypothetical protein